MQIDSIQAAVAERPFRPFTLHVSDGMSYPVPTAQSLALRPGDNVVFIWKPTDGGYSFVEAASVTRLEFEAEVPECFDNM